MGTVHTMPGLISKVDVPPDWLFDKAKDGGIEEALVIGWTKDGEFWFGGTSCDTGRILVLIERAKRQIVEGID